MPVLLRMPEVAANTTEAVLASWPVAVGAGFRAHDTIATVETAKAAVDVEADNDGVLLATLVSEGTEVAIGDPIALLAVPGEHVADLDAALADLGVTQPDRATRPEPAHGVPATEPELSGAAPAARPDASSTNGGAPAASRVFASPLARRLARQAGLSIDQIAGTGPNSRIVRRDVEATISRNSATAATAVPTTSTTPAADAQPAGSPSAAAPFVDIAHSHARRAIAAQLTASKQTAPHFYLRATAKVDRLVRLRAELNDGLPVRVSLTDLIVKAVSQAHQLVPEMNVIWTPDAVRSFSTVDISVAVATDQGLRTPVLRSVDSLSITGITRTADDLVDRARRGALRQHELEGGTITVTNLGMYGTEEFAAIINPPQAAILAVGAVLDEPMVRDGQLSIGSAMHVTLSVDHRPVDGVTAARWLRAFVDLVEHPLRILA